MRYICTSIVAMFVLVSTSTADDYTIATDGMTFVPATLDVQPGDIITFEVGPYHTATSGSSCSSDGLFDFGSGTNTWTVPDSVAGTTVDYFCIPHCSMGMTGSINVAEVINVPGDVPTIQGAIYASVNGNVINVAAGTYYVDNLNTVGKAITLQGTLNEDGSLATTLVCQHDGDGTGSQYAGLYHDRAFMFNHFETRDTVIRDFRMIGTPIYAYGGVMQMRGSSPTISNCTITGGYAIWGGAIHVRLDGANPKFIDCTISGNHAIERGGAISQDKAGSFVLVDCKITDNSNGGGLVFASAIHVSNADWFSPDPVINRCDIRDNTSEWDKWGDFSPAIFIGGSASMRIQDSQICGNDGAEQIVGKWTDVSGNTVADECPEEDCVPDLNDSGAVDIEDLLLLIGGWGTPDGDCDDDGDTDIEDLLVLIGGWGACP